MEDIIGNAYGLDIIGRNNNPPIGVPPYGVGFPAGQPYFPVNSYGWPGTVNPFAAYGLPDPSQQMQAPPPGAMMQAPPDGVAGRGGFGGFGGGFGGGDLASCLAQLVAPLLIQQNREPAIGLAPRCPTRNRTEFVGFEGCEVPACGTVTLRCSPCVWLKIIRFVIPSSIASQITVDQITINGKETLINCGPVPGEMFLPDATYVETIATETIQPGCCIEIQITNISNASLFVNMGGVARVVY